MSAEWLDDLESKNRLKKEKETLQSNNIKHNQDKIYQNQLGERIRRICGEVNNKAGLTLTFKSISSFISMVSKQFKEILGYLAKFMKDTQIYKGLVKMEAQMSKAFSGILSKIKTAFGENIVKNVGKSVNYTKHVGQHYAQHQTQHDLTHNVAGALVH